MDENTEKEEKIIGNLIRESILFKGGDIKFEEVYEPLMKRIEEEKKVSITDFFSRYVLTPKFAYTFASFLILIISVFIIFNFIYKEKKNECYVDSFDIIKGTVIVEEDIENRKNPTIIWYFEKEG